MGNSQDLAGFDEGNFVSFRVASLIPEPTTGVLVMVGVLGLAVRRRH